MSNFLIHNLDIPWSTSNAALLHVSIDDRTFFVEGTAGNRFVASSGALNTFAEFNSPVPLDLSPFEEVRFWIRADQKANGSKTHPFFLEFSYTDANDGPAEEHRWFVPVNQAATWEQRRIGIENDRRSNITGFRFTSLTNASFICTVDELLAVQEEMLLDLEQTFTAQFDNQIALPGLTGVPLSQPANPGDTQVILPFTPGFGAGNRLLLQGGSAGDEFHRVTNVTHNTPPGTTTLQFDPADPVVGALAAATTTVSVTVPVLVEAPPTAIPSITPAVIVTHLDAREDLERTAYLTQRDSFRRQGGVVVCSTRPAARAYTVDYQLTVTAPDRRQQLFIHTQLLRQLSTDNSLRINGCPSPVWLLPPPELEERSLGILAPIYIRCGTRLETAPRQEQTWARQAEVFAAPLDAPLDREQIVLDL